MFFCNYVNTRNTEVLGVFTHLHNHSEFSFFDGCSKLENMFAKAKSEGMSAVAITDHHNVFAWFEAIQYARKYGIDCIFGMEINVGKNHITALAMNQTGIKNLITMNNLGYEKSGRPNISENQLFAHAEGIFFLSGCSKGKIPTLISKGCYEEAVDTAVRYKEKFSNYFALEIQHFKAETYLKNVEGIIHIAKKARIGIVPTNDCHYLEAAEFHYHDRLLSVKTNGKVHASNGENYFKTIEDMGKLFPSYILDQTEVVRKKCRADFESFVQEQDGGICVPLAMVYRYGDADAFRKAFFSQKKFKLGEYWYKKMKEEDLVLEDLSLKNNAEEIQTAYSLRGRISLVLSDPYYYVKTTAYMPLYRKSKDDAYCAQMDIKMAQQLGLVVYDRRRQAAHA